MSLSDSQIKTPYRYPTYKWNISLFCRNNVGVLKPWCVKSISGNIITYLHFLSFLNIEMVQVLEILPHGRQGLVYLHIQYMRCRYSTVDFLQNHHKRFSSRASYGLSFVGSNLDSYSAPATAVMYIISCYTGPRYNGAQLYHGCWWPGGAI